MCPHVQKYKKLTWLEIIIDNNLTMLTFHFSLLNDQMEKFRKECSELKVQNAKLASQVSNSSF